MTALKWTGILIALTVCLLGAIYLGQRPLGLRLNLYPGGKTVSLSLAAPAGSGPREEKIVGGLNAFGCADPSTYERIDLYALNGDQDDFQRSFSGNFLNGKCVSLDSEEQVYVQDGPDLPGLIQILRKRDGKIYWTSALSAR